MARRKSEAERQAPAATETAAGSVSPAAQPAAPDPVATGAAGEPDTQRAVDARAAEEPSGDAAEGLAEREPVEAPATSSGEASASPDADPAGPVAYERQGTSPQSQFDGYALEEGRLNDDLETRPPADIPGVLESTPVARWLSIPQPADRDEADARNREALLIALADQPLSKLQMLVAGVQSAGELAFVGAEALIVTAGATRRRAGIAWTAGEVRAFRDGELTRDQVQALDADPQFDVRYGSA